MRTKIHNLVLWTITGFMFMVLVVSVASADSDNYLWIVTMFVSLGWLAVFSKVNEKRWG